MRRILWFTLKLGVFVAFALWFIGQSGDASFVWHGYEYRTYASVLGLAVLALAFAFYLVFRFWRFIVNGPEMWRLRRRLRNAHKAHRMLTEGLTAVAAGNAAEAGRLAVGARKMLGNTTAAQLLQAQAAQLAGDHKAAREIFTVLAAEPGSAVLGYRGLIMEALRARNWDEAAKLADKLYRIRPETPWLNLIRFELATRRQAWDEAGAALKNISAARLMESGASKRHQAAVLAAIALEEARQGHANESLQAAEQSVRLNPNWIPGIIALAKQQMDGGHHRAARRSIERVWANTSHPQLAAIYRNGGDANPIKAYKRVEYLCRGNEERPSSRIVLAEAALAADIWGEARRHLLALDAKGAATQGAYRLLARLERCESGNERAALQWLTRAIDALPDPVWLCRACGGTHEEWQAACTHCGSFNALEWQSPGQSHANETPPMALLASWAE